MPGTILGNQQDQKKRLESVEAKQAENLKRIEQHDAGLKAEKDAREKLEADFNKRRLNTGGGDTTEPDALRNALPDDLKRWIPHVRTLKAGEAFADGHGLIQRRSSASAKLAQRDPALYIAIGGWMQAHIKRQIAAQKGEGKVAEKWTKRIEELELALEGSPELVQQRAALAEGTDATGGYIVPTITEAMIGWLMKEASVVRAAGATIIQMTTQTHELPSLANDFTVTWDAEAATIADSAPASPLGSATLTAKRENGLVTISLELVQDNIINLMDFLMTHLIQQLGRKEDEQALEGDGTVFTGLFSVSGTNSVNNNGAAAGSGVTVTLASWLAMMYGGEHQSTLDNAVTFCHPWVIRDLMQTTIASGTLPVLPFLGANEARPRNILGEPVHPTSVILRNRSGATNETAAYHGDPQYIVIGDRMATQFDVNPWSETEFKKGQVLLRVLRRVGIVIWVPKYFTKLLNIEVT